VLQKNQQVLSKSQHSSLAPMAGLDWEDIRIFLLLAEVRSFREVGRVLDRSFRTVQSRFEAFEHALGRALFVRSNNGLVLTPDGAALRQQAEVMYNGARRLAASMANSKDQQRTVRIGCTEGLGSFWIVPRLLELVEREKDIGVYLNCEIAPQDVANLAVDFAIQFELPKDPDLVVVRLCWLHVVLFASQEYVRRHGKPASKSEIDNFNVLEISGAQIWSHALRLDEHAKPKDAFVRFGTNTASAQLIGVKRGGGLTAIPTYSETITTGLVHVAEDWLLTRDVWLVCNRQVKDQPQVRKCIDYIRDVFNPARFPWFRENYIPPAEIRRFIEEHQLQSLFEGYSDYSHLPADPDHELPSDPILDVRVA
jgi:DNA-binding transcriptional LysR family regulator